MSPDECRQGLLRRALARLTAPIEEIEAEELREESRGEGAQQVSDLADRQQATVCGTLRTVTIQPRAGLPSLAAELYDGTGALDLIWLGRRRIPGINPGRTVVARGRVSVVDDHMVIFNPRYELRARATE